MPHRSALLVLAAATAYIPQRLQRLRPALLQPSRQICRLHAAADDEDPEILLAKAEFLRQQAAYLEESMPKREPVGLQPQESKDPSLDGMTVVVTGANGEVGSIVTEELLTRGCRVRAIVRSAEDQGSY